MSLRVSWRSCAGRLALVVLWSLLCRTVCEATDARPDRVAASGRAATDARPDLSAAAHTGPGPSAASDTRPGSPAASAASGLRLRLLRPHSVFRPGELFVGVVDVPVPASRTRPVSGLLCWFVSRPGSKLPLVAGTKPARVDPNSPFGRSVPLCFPVPTDEGVFDLLTTFVAAGLRPLSVRRSVVVVDTRPKRTTGRAAEAAPLRPRLVALWPENGSGAGGRDVELDVASVRRLEGSVPQQPERSVRQPEPPPSTNSRPLPRSLSPIRPLRSPVGPLSRPPAVSDLFGLSTHRAGRPAAQWTDASLSALSRLHVAPAVRVGRPSGEPTWLESSAGWRAWSVPVSRPGCPHLLVVTVARACRQATHAAVGPGDSLQENPASADRAAVTLTLVDRNGERPATPLQPAVALVPSVLPGDRRGAGPSDESTWSVWFQPDGKEVLLVARAADGWRVQSLALYELPSSSSQPTVRDPLRGNQRLVGPYVHLRAWLHALGEADGDGPLRPPSLYAAGRRLVERLKSSGFNAALLAVEPNGRWPGWLTVGVSTPGTRTQLGAPGDEGDPWLDELELLFCLFDRAGLVLVPHLRFNRPLPELEAEATKGANGPCRPTPRETNGANGLRRAAARRPAASAVELVGWDGRTWRQSHSGPDGRPSACGPLYNPLHPKVQAAVERVVRELVRRYGHHRSFQAVSLELGADTFLLWPGLGWGYDDQTVQAFLHDTGLRLPDDAADASRRAEFLTGVVRRRWVQWRCERLAEFHKRLVDAVVSVKPSCRVLLSAGRVFRHSVLDRDVRVELRRGRRLEPLLRERGLDFSLYADRPQLVVLRPWVSRATLEPLEQSVDETLNASPWVDRLFAGPVRGTVCLHVPFTELVSGSSSSDCSERPAAAGSGTHRSDLPQRLVPLQPLLVQPADDVRSHQRRLAHALAAYDSQLLFDDNWLVTAPPATPRLLRFVRTFRSLPPLPFRLCERQSQPVVVRTANDGRRSYLYVVNDFPGPVDVWLTLQCPDSAKLKLLGDSRSVSVDRTLKGQRTLKWTLSPYELWACRVEGGPVRVASVSTALRPEQWRAIHGLLEQLRARLESMASETAWEVPLQDPGFEADQADGDGSPIALTDWQQPAASRPRACGFSRQQPHSGQHCLQVSAGTQATTVVSRPFDTRFCSTLVFRFWARGTPDPTSLQLAVVGHAGAVAFRKAATTEVGPTWRLYQFRASNLPPNADTVRLELTVPAGHTCWLDDVELSLQRFSEGELRRFTKSLAAAQLAWEEKRYADCVRLLNSYWCCLLAQTTAPVRAQPLSAGSPLSGSTASPPRAPAHASCSQHEPRHGHGGLLEPRRRVRRSAAYR